MEVLLDISVELISLLSVLHCLQHLRFRVGFFFFRYFKNIKKIFLWLFQKIRPQHGNCLLNNFESTFFFFSFYFVPVSYLNRQGSMLSIYHAFPSVLFKFQI